MITTSHFPAFVPTVFILARFSHPTGSLASFNLIDSPGAKPNHFFNAEIFDEISNQTTFAFVRDLVFLLNVNRLKLTFGFCDWFIFFHV